MRPLRRFALKSALFVLLPLLACDLLAGALLRPRDTNNFRASHPYFHHGLRPDTTGRSQWGDGQPYTVTTNSLGLIDGAQRDVPKRARGGRIVLLGDSYTEGIGVPWAQTFAGLLADRLAVDGVEVLNAAAMSYSPKLYHLKARWLLEHVGLELDRLVVLIDISDIQDEVLYRNFEPRVPGAGDAARAWLERASFTFDTVDTLLRARRRAQERRKYNAEVYPPWLDYFWLDNKDTTPYADPDFPRIRSEWTSDELFDDRWTSLGVARALESMRLLVDLCREHDVALSVGVYPWPDQIQRGELESRQVFLWETFCEAHGLPFLDLFPTFVAAPGLTPDEVYGRYFIAGDVHWNAAGHRLVADALEAFLAR